MGGARNSLVTGIISYLKRARGIVIYVIWPELIFFSGVAVTADSTKSISPALLTVLGTVLGLVISFRTTSAYDRYWEGRKLWTTIALSSRNLASLIWIHVPTDRSPKSDPPPPDSELPPDANLRALIEKRSMVNLIQAFSTSLKHYLRGETGIYYRDVYPLIAFLPQYASKVHDNDPNTHLPIWSSYTNSGGPHIAHDGTDLENGTGPWKEKKRTDGFDPESALPKIKPDNVHLAPARLPPEIGFFEFFPIFMPLKSLYKFLKERTNKNQKDNEAQNRNTWTGKKIHRPVVESVVPLEIALYLSSYFNFLMTKDLLRPAAATSFNNNLHALQDAAVQLRRVATTPIPFAYQAHLRMAVWLYLLFLPFQIYDSLGWLTIPATTFSAFLYLGFLEIGAEMLDLFVELGDNPTNKRSVSSLINSENPFQYDENDLDIDLYCLSIARDLAEITAHNPIPPEEYIFSSLNQPFAPTDFTSALDLTTNLNKDHAYLNEGANMQTLRAKLVQGWRTVSKVTTDHRKKISA
ncbi:Bestrophin protein [Ceratobasidium theobromae]|uniref:Bestrophin protein n=1 Tax=Ceratobasidium theobromae TaxID=1582974 RepID=A0A5N5QIU9_9AGAM|nr:Bestrophin protein [Ceratobasidium theobromae]